MIKRKIKSLFSKEKESLKDKLKKHKTKKWNITFVNVKTFDSCLNQIRAIKVNALVLIEPNKKEYHEEDLNTYICSSHFENEENATICFKLNKKEASKLIEKFEIKEYPAIISYLYQV